MTRGKFRRRFSRCLYPGISLISGVFGSLPNPAHADEGGYSFWLPRPFSSLAAAPQVPGWSWPRG